MAWRRLLWAQATEVVRQHYAPCSIGRAEAELLKAWKSGEVRTWTWPRLAADDGLVDPNTGGVAPKATHPDEIDEDDLLDWLARHPPQSVVQNIHDDKEGNVRRILNDKYPNSAWVGLPTKTLINVVNDYLEGYCRERNIPIVKYHPDTISRGIFRKRKPEQHQD
jgi:hypothetical protein